MPDQQLSPVKSGEESPNKMWAIPTILGRSIDLLSTTLPHSGLQSEDSIAINKDGERLDVFCPHPSPEAMDQYHRRAKEHKVCNSYHLSGECGDMSCQYDHSDVSDTIIEVLRYILLQHPCPRAGACRSIKCYMGHLCQKPNCKAVKSWQCRFNQRGHTMDLNLAQWIAPIEQQTDGDQSSISGDSYDRESSSPNTFVF